MVIFTFLRPQSSYWYSLRAKESTTQRRGNYAFRHYWNWSIFETPETVLQVKECSFDRCCQHKKNEPSHSAVIQNENVTFQKHLIWHSSKCPYLIKGAVHLVWPMFVVDSFLPNEPCNRLKLKCRRHTAMDVTIPKDDWRF